MKILQLELQQLNQITAKEAASSFAIAVGLFLAMGTVTALWKNSYFIRMTPVSEWDFMFLVLESLLLGFFLGIQVQGCASKEAGVGGVFGFLGFGCSICNKLLLMLFGSSFLIYYFEPVRYYLGALGIAVLTYALYQKLLFRFEDVAPATVMHET